MGRPVPPDELESILRANAAAAEAIVAAARAGAIRAGWPQMSDTVELARLRG
jgi:hypothetical protein